MVNEQKAKAYDEALERARKQRDDYQKELDKTDKNSQLAGLLRAGISAVEMIFPQLKESNDEKIRKDIIDHFESIKAQALYDNQEESDNIISSCNEKIAYLEKQQEASKAIEAIKRIDNYIDENVTNAHDMKDSLPDKKYCQGIDDTLADIARILQDVYSGEKQKELHFTKRNALFDKCVENCDPIIMKKVSDEVDEILKKEQKHIDYISGIREELLDIENNAKDIDGLTESQWVAIRAAHRLLGEYIEQEQKPAEWSEEDEMMRENIISDLRYFNDCATDEEAVSDYEEEIAWLKDIFLNHKKFDEAVDKLCSNEWSEEDKEALDMCLDAIPKRWKTKSGILLTKWLKDNIHLQSKQKWSEEDERMINTLVSYVEDPSCWNLNCPKEKLVSFLKSLRPQKLDASKLENFDPVDVLNRIKTEWPMAWEKVVGKQEWSEEDGKDIAHIIEILDDCYAFGRHDLSKTNHENLVNKLKSLHPIKQEWTEEDEEIIYSLRSFLILAEQSGRYGSIQIAQIERCLNWLKSLHPSWEPSKKQMDALKNVAYGVYQNGDGPALRELYEQLLKLGVKEEQN